MSTTRPALRWEEPLVRRRIRLRQPWRHAWHPWSRTWFTLIKTDLYPHETLLTISGAYFVSVDTRHVTGR
ncbi:hypothetical protein NDU88_001627 [Pleurodeles waltl]|uniref:Uncharacterized protein n=1 Tax=Pleurodeles waltl TaxID=8319 RepID=A0AAV7LZ42_PLEWA|nr:hypothetical protein NDU88_001627 [Pleurodeles waltl]